jgi:hypothetical protein
MFATVNAAVQTGAIVASNAGIIWAMYPIMMMFAYVSFMQSVASAGVFSGIVKDTGEVKDTGYGLRALIGILYLASSYQVYMIGYEVFSGVMLAHATIYLLTNIFGVLKN